jgi:hypothetical protein
MRFERDDYVRDEHVTSFAIGAWPLHRVCYSAGTLLDRTPARRVLADAEVCSVPVVVGDEGADHLAEVALVQER